MEKIIEPVKREKLIAELKFCKFIKYTFRRGNEIYSFVNTDAPSIMVEVGRLREEAFRSIGCGTGDIVDLDDYDMGAGAYRQLIVWNPREQEIIGGYRYAVGSNYLQQIERLSMSHYFRYSAKFKAQYLPYSIELGRAWVNPVYRPTATDGNSIFALDNLWEGIGAIIAENTSVRYLYGKVTIPENYNPTARILLSWFLDHYFKGKNNLLSPRTPIVSPKVLAISGNKVTGTDPDRDYKIIAKYIKSLDVAVPPLISAYLRLAKRITTFGTTANPELGNAFETGILIAIKDIHPEKHTRYINTTIQKKQLMFASQE
jgi:hypothetical protein